MRRALLAGLLLLALEVRAVAVASGHAVLESSTPARGAQLEKPPAEVTFSFNEAVESTLGAVRIFDTEGRQVQVGDLKHPGGQNQTVGATLPRDLPDGLYTATYRVVSADSHPVTGGITFTVGEPDRGEDGFAQGMTISELLAGSSSGQVTEVGFWFIRWVGYLAIALAVGALFWMLFLLRPRPALPDELERELAVRFRRVFVLPAAAAGLLASLAAIPFQGAIATGSSFWHAFGSGIPAEVIGTRYGTVMLVRAAIWAVILGLVAFRPAGFRRIGAVGIAGLLAATLLVITPALGGHASTRDPGWLLIPSDVIHVAAMAIWAGGLAAMLWILPAVTRRITRPEDRTRLLTEATMRFSAAALLMVALIGVSGAIQAIIDVGSIDGLVSTAFGRAVLIKIVIFAAICGFGAANRMRIVPALVRRMEAAQSPGTSGNSLRLTLRAEMLLVLVILGVTAALVSYPPPDAIRSGPVSGSVETDGKLFEYTVDPSRVGSNEIHVYLFDDATGAPVPAKSAEMSFTLPAEDIAPIAVETRPVGPGHYMAPSAMLGVKGEWLASVVFRLSRFDEQVIEFEVPVR